YNDCSGLSGDIVPILDRLDPAIDVVVSGHTHHAYICDYRPPHANRSLLLTSAGRYGMLLTDIELAIDARANQVVGKSARNMIVQSEGFTDSKGRTIAPVAAYPRFDRNPEVAAIVARYAEAAAPLAQRTVGTLTASLSRWPAASGES